MLALHDVMSRHAGSVAGRGSEPPEHSPKESRRGLSTLGGDMGADSGAIPEIFS